MTSASHKAPRFSAITRLSNFMALAKAIAAAQLRKPQAPAQCQAATAAVLSLPVLLLLSACAQGPRHPASPPRPQAKPYSPERFSHLRWQDSPE